MRCRAFMLVISMRKIETSHSLAVLCARIGARIGREAADQLDLMALEPDRVGWADIVYVLSTRTHETPRFAVAGDCVSGENPEDPGSVNLLTIAEAVDWLASELSDEYADSVAEVRKALDAASAAH